MNPTLFKELDLDLLKNIRTDFSISDLENFSGIKAHTLRIWEKRYGLLTPSRTSGNQRSYNLDELLKLLNIKVLYDNGHKISKIGGYGQEKVNEMVEKLLCHAKELPCAVDNLKIAMLNFDQSLFERTYRHLIEEMSFRQIFMEVFIPLLDQIGHLWQANSITPAHEHFISNLIQQKVLSTIERLHPMRQEKKDSVFVLYLPLNEIHDLGLLFLHYELILRGYHSIYLGQSVPLANLEDLKVLFGQVTFVSYFTVQPIIDELPGYLLEVKNQLLERKEDEFWLCGRKSTEVDPSLRGGHLLTFSGVQEVMAHLDAQRS